MPANVTKTERIHDLLPAAFHTRTNPNWSGIVEAIGSQDQLVADLVEEVRKQFFVRTSSRPYIDRLAANNLLSRPRLLGMDDPTFRKYIPVLSYQPKQVKLIIDQLLDIFFSKESTTVFMSSTLAEPFVLESGWELDYIVNGYQEEHIQFKTSDFVDISNAQASEIASAINRQARYSFAIAFFDNILKRTLVRIFTKTIGAKGSLQLLGGRAIIALQPDGFISDAGNGSDTEYTVTKIGDEMTFEWTAGTSPQIGFLKTDDIVVINLVGNSGSFAITSVDLTNNRFIFRNLLGTPGIITQTTANDIKFIRPTKFVISDTVNRSVAWEVNSGEIEVEMSASPPVVRRFLSGSAHLNGTVTIMSSRLSDTSLTLQNPDEWPVTGGTFKLEAVNEILTRILTITEDETISTPSNTRLNGINDITYSYTGISGNVMSGISPDLPVASSLNSFSLSSLSRDAFNTGTAVTGGTNTYEVGEYVIISGSSDPSLNGSWLITNIVNNTTFEFYSEGPVVVAATGASSRVERIGLANSGSRLTLNNATLDTGITGPNIFDENAAYVLSSLTSTVATEIRAGKIVPILDIGPNDIPNAPGFVIFDYGTANIEGPIRFLYKPNATSLALDPSYVFQNTHDVGAPLVMIRRKGGIVLTHDGAQFPAYITDTSVARITLQELILSVKSAGVFVNFLVRFPEQLYGAFDVYNSGAIPE